MAEATEPTTTEQIDRSAMIDAAVEQWVGIMTDHRNGMINRQAIMHEFYLANQDKIDGKDNEAWFEAMRADPNLRHHIRHPSFAKKTPEEVAAELDAGGFTEENIQKFGSAMREELVEESKKQYGRMTLKIENNYAYVDLPVLMDKAGIPRGYCPARNNYEWKLDFAKGTIIENIGTIYEKKLYPVVPRQALGDSVEKSDVASRF